MDNVNHPEHYTSGGIECIDAIRASLGDKEFADYCKGNIIKYLWRYRLKNGAEDLRKARVYLNWMIEAEEREGQPAPAPEKEAKSPAGHRRAVGKRGLRKLHVSLSAHIVSCQKVSVCMTTVRSLTDGSPA